MYASFRDALLYDGSHMYVTDWKPFATGGTFIACV